MKKIFLIIVLFATYTTVCGQASSLFGISWEANFPSNGNYITKSSYRGGKFEYRHLFKKNWSVGLAVNWATYEQYFNRQTFNDESGNNAVTGDFLAQTYQIPITATVHYYFQGGKMIKPYAGLGIGGQSLVQSLYYNVYVSEDNNWGFVMRPEAGILISPDQFGYWGFIVGASYSYATNKTDLVGNTSFKNFGVNIGVVFTQ